MGLFDMFMPPANPAATPPPELTPANPGNIPLNTGAAAPTAPGTETNGIVPVVPAVPDIPDSPLAEFEKLWEPIAIKATPDGKPATLDPARLQEVIGKASFTQAVTPDNLAKIQAGGEEATVALMETLNAVARQTITQSTLAANKMIEQAVTNMKTETDAAIPDLIRQQTLASNLKADDPIFSNPAVKPIMEATQAQLAGKFPDATPNELMEMTKRYITAMGEAFAPKAPAINGVPQNQDFSKFLV